jgi:hypothetical protein
MAEDLERERERMGRSIEGLTTAHAILDAIILAGEPIAAQAH